MSFEYESRKVIDRLKKSAEETTGESYSTLTEAHQTLKNGYGQGGKEEMTKYALITENGTHSILPDEGKTLREAIVTVGIKCEEVKDEVETTLDITENGTTELVPEEGETFSKVTVNVDVPSSVGGMGIIYSDFTGGTYNLPKKADISSLEVVSENLSASTMQSGNALFSYLFKNSSASAAGGFNAFLEEVECGGALKFFGSYMFEYCSNLKTLKGDFSKVVSVSNNAFAYCSSLEQIPEMPNLTAINGYAFRNCTALTEVRFYSKPTISNNAFISCSNLKDIYVPWLEGEVSNAPWGATNATIHYNSEV